MVASRVEIHARVKSTSKAVSRQSASRHEYRKDSKTIKVEPSLHATNFNSIASSLSNNDNDSSNANQVTNRNGRVEAMNKSA